HRIVDGTGVAEAGGFSVGAGLLCGGVGNPPLERIAVKFRKKHSTFNIQRSTFNFVGRYRSIGCSMLNVECWMFLLLLICLFPHFSSAQTNEQRALVLVIGAAGEPEYGEQFSAWADLWKQAA